MDIQLEAGGGITVEFFRVKPPLMAFTGYTSRSGTSAKIKKGRSMRPRRSPGARCGGGEWRAFGRKVKVAPQPPKQSRQDRKNARRNA